MGDMLSRPFRLLLFLLFQLVTDFLAVSGVRICPAFDWVRSSMTRAGGRAI